MKPEYARALAAFSALIDDKTGVIRSVDLVKLSDPDPAVFLAFATPCNTSPLTGAIAANRGGACGMTPEAAIVRACGESVERYCSAFFTLDEMRLAPARQLVEEGGRLVRVEEVYPFAPWQYNQPGFPYQPTGDERAIRWVPGASVISGVPVWLPASCVYVPYMFDLAVEPFTHMPISTGLAAGPDVAYCIEKGIFEIVERDALMVTWYGRIPAPRVIPESCRGLHEEIDALLDILRGTRSRWHLNRLNVDIDVPVVSAALIDDGAPPLTSFGIAANTDVARAVLLAMEEAVLTRTLVNRNREVWQEEAGSAAAEGSISTLRDHLFAHARSAELRERSSFLLDDGEPLDLVAWLSEEQRRPARTAIERLSEAGFDAVFAEVTSPDVKDVGIRVVRTVIPGMQPLDNDHRYRYLGGKRLISVPRGLGRELTVEDLNTDPHPFP